MHTSPWEFTCTILKMQISGICTLKIAEVHQPYGLPGTIS